MWILILLVGLYFVGQSEFLKLRYNKESFLNSISMVHGVQPSFDTFEVEDKSLHTFKLVTTSPKPLLILVHGSPGSLQAYEDFLKDRELFASFDMIAVDRSGFGYSDFGVFEPSLSRQARLLAEVLMDYAERKTILVGHSMGGPVITKTAMDFPELVNGLVMIAPSISANLEPSTWWRKLIDFPPFRFVTPPALRVCNQEIIPLKEELKDIELDWAKIKAPVTFIHGTKDPLVPHGNSDYGTEMLKNSSHVEIKKLKDKNHFILWNEIPAIKSELFKILDIIEKI